VDLFGSDELSAITVPAFAIAFVTLWWAFRGRSVKRSVHSAANSNNEGMARFLAGDLAGAIVLIDESLRRDPGLAAGHYNRAVVLASQRQHAEALASIDAMFTCRPAEVEALLDISDPWYLRGQLRLELGDYHGAIDDLSHAFDLDPSNRAMLLCNRGLAWLKLGQLEQALHDTNEALLLAPEDAVAYNNRGVIFRDLGDFEKAESDLRRAIEIDPQLPNPREHLAKLLEASENTPEFQAFG